MAPRDRPGRSAQPSRSLGPPGPPCRGSRRSSRDARGSPCSRAASRSRSSCHRSERFPQTKRCPPPAREQASRSVRPGRGRDAGLTRRGAHDRTRTAATTVRSPASSRPVPPTQAARVQPRSGRQVVARFPPCCQVCEQSDRSNGCSLLSILATKYGGRARCARRPSTARRDRRHGVATALRRPVRRPRRPPRPGRSPSPCRARARV
jgi:hypothetical protein